jgi:chromosome segregation ATPase
MKTDSLFYSVFKNILQLGLDFLDLPYAGDNYNFVSEEIKQTGFRIDGLFKANEKNPNYRMSLRSANGLFCQEALNLKAWGSDLLYPYLAAERQTQSEALVHERDHHAQQAQQLQSQVDALNQAHTVLAEEKTTVTQNRDALSIELATMTQARDEQTHLAAELQTQIEALVHERNYHAQQAQQLQSQVDALNQTNTLLNQEKSAFAEQQAPLKNELAALKQSVDQQALSLSQSHTECEQLHNQLQQQEAIMANLKVQYSENDARQRLLNDEMIKAEAQLELIKDLLLREPGL